jgi:hypothetical protein
MSTHRPDLCRCSASQSCFFASVSVAVAFVEDEEDHSAAYATSTSWLQFRAVTPVSARPAGSPR